MHRQLAEQAKGILGILEVPPEPEVSPDFPPADTPGGTSPESTTGGVSPGGEALASRALVRVSISCCEASLLGCAGYFGVL